MSLTASQYNDILRLYDEKQARNRLDRDRRVDEAFARYPRLREIADEIAQISMESARHRILQGGDDTTLQERIGLLAEERRALLSMGGFPEDQLDLRFDCPLCSDTGFVDGEKCVCFRREESRLLYAQSKLDRLLNDETFDTFSLDYYSTEILNDDDVTARDAAASALESARRFAATFGRDFRNLFITGEVGTGKTFLTHCIAGELLARDHRVLYFTSGQLFDLLGKATFGRDTSLAGAPDDILSCDLLIIDDLGSEFTNSFVSTWLFTCVNERILARRPTIISTNLSLGETRDLYSERIASRITGHYEIIKLFGQDIRYQKQIRKGDLT